MEPVDAISGRKPSSPVKRPPARVVWQAGKHSPQVLDIVANDAAMPLGTIAAEYG